MSNLADEWHLARRTPWVWLLPLAVVGGAVLLGPLNAGFYREYFQGTFDTDDGYYLSDGVNLHTSGFFPGQIIAMLFGALLVLCDRSGAAPVRRSKLAAAALGGAVLGLTAVVAAACVAAGRLDDLWALDAVFHQGEASRPNPLHHLATWRAIIVGLIGFPIWAVSGVGLAALLRWRIWLLGVLLLGPVAMGGVLSWIDLGEFESWPPEITWWAFPLCLLAAPFLVLAMPATLNFLTILFVAGDPSWISAGVVVGFMLAYAWVSVHDGRAAWRRRLAPAEVDDRSQ